jgi:hypothetical protein
MISNVTQYGSLLVLRDQQGQQVGTLSVSNGELLGYSRDFVVVQFDGMIVTMDENQRTLGRLILSSDYRIQGINESGFCARTGSQVMVYDPYCNKINQYSV